MCIMLGLRMLQHRHEHVQLWLYVPGLPSFPVQPCPTGVRRGSIGYPCGALPSSLRRHVVHFAPVPPGNAAL